MDKNQKYGEIAHTECDCVCVNNFKILFFFRFHTFFSNYFIIINVRLVTNLRVLLFLEYTGSYENYRV